MASEFATAIDPQEIQRLGDTLEGRIIAPDSAEYDDARHVFNAMIDRHPAVIARVAGPEDVIRCLEFAAKHDLPVAVRGGGHNVGGFATVDGGIVIDFSERQTVTVDPESRTATAEAGPTWYDFDQQTQGYGLATTGGLVSTTGIAGFTLGGGIGWLVRKHGLACDNLIGADVVTADGRTIRVDEQENADLLWALRGGGGNFGVVTSFRYQLHPVGQVLGGLLVYPRDRAHDVLRFYRDYVADAPDELTTVAALITSPEGMPVCGIAACYAGDVAAGERVLQPLRAFGPPLADQMGPMPYAVMQTALDPMAPPGMRHYWKADFLDMLSDEAIDGLVDAANAARAPLSQVHLHHLGGAFARVPADATAFAHRDAGFVFNLVGTWQDPAEDDLHTAWGRDAFDALRPASAGSAYINFLGDDGADRVAAAYAGNHGRLVELKRKFDPDNRFRLNQNIAP